MPVHVSGPPDGWVAPPFDRSLFEARAEALLAAVTELESLTGAEAELSISLIDDDLMAAMNERFRERVGPTDVLSFSLLEGEHAEHRGGMLGDVVLDLEVAERQAREQGHSLDDELLRLLIHGTLHLLGHDHEEEAEARVMQAREQELWGRLTP